MNPAAEWVAMISDLPNIHFTAEADTGKFSYRYASLPSILEKVRPVLSKHGWVVTQDVTTSEGGQPQVTTLFDHKEGGQRHYGPLTVPATGSGAQAVGSAITYARRYALVAALGLAPDGDDDGAAASRTPQTDPHSRAWSTIFHLAGDDQEAAKQLWWQAHDTAGIDPKTQLVDDEADRLIAAAKEAIT